MLSDQMMSEHLEDPSMLLFGDLPIAELASIFTAAEARELASAAGLDSQSVTELAHDVTRERRRLGWVSK